MKTEISVRNLLITLFLFIILVGIGYKYYEWSQLQNLATLYNQSWTQELNLVQEENKNYITFLDLYKKVTDKEASKEEFTKSYSELIGDLRLTITSQENYLSTVKQNADLYSNINVSFLRGERGDFANKLVSHQKQYYTYEIDDARISDAANWLVYNMITAWNDMGTVGRFSDEISNNPLTAIPKYFPDLSPIQKYTNNDFEFEHGIDIQKYYPNGYDALTKYKDYYVSYYMTGQNYANGDSQSAAYTFSTLKEKGTSLNYNFSDLFKQETNHLNDNANNIIQIVAQESNDIKNFESQGLSKYPFLSKIASMKVDLVLCQMYDFKAKTYHSITTNYIKANNVSSLLSELSTIPPSTQLVDVKFDKKSLDLINDDKKIQFTCIDKTDNTKYQFVSLK